MNIINRFPTGYSVTPFHEQRFYEINYSLSFEFANLSLWQVLEMKNFAKRTPHLLFEHYGYNAEEMKGKGTLKMWKFKEWTTAELTELKEIVGEGMSSFWNFLSNVN